MGLVSYSCWYFFFLLDLQVVASIPSSFHLLSNLNLQFWGFVDLLFFNVLMVLVVFGFLSFLPLLSFLSVVVG